MTAQRLKSFFDDIQPEFPNVAFKVKGNMFYINDEYAGQAQALSTGKILKSIPFPKVSKICFDEFILDKGVYHYLQDEVTKFLDSEITGKYEVETNTRGLIGSREIINPS